MSERIKKGISQACLYDKLTVQHIAQGLDTFIDISTKAGFDGVEIHPANWPKNICSVATNPKYSDKILSGHQTFERSTMPASTQANFMHFIIDSILEDYDKSIDVLDTIFEEIGKRRLVAYHHVTPEISTKNFSDVSIQLKPDAFEAWGVNCLPGFIDEALKRGFSSVTFDTTHTLTTIDHYPSLGSLSNVIDGLAKHNVLKHAHIAVARPDNYLSVPNGKEIQMNWGYQLLNWVEGDMLDIIRQLKDSGVDTMIVELLPSGINDIDSNMPYWNWNQNTVEYVFSKIGESLDRTLEECGNW